MSSFRRAREALGLRLRELRREFRAHGVVRATSRHVSVSRLS
jgi:hypothetical protein